MSQELREIQEYARHLKNTHTQRVEMQNAMERLYLMEWSDENRVASLRQGIVPTKSPDLRNKLGGAIELLIATEPAWAIPFEKNDALGQQVSSKLEKAAAQIWTAASRIRRLPLHYDVVVSAMTYGEVHIAMTRTEDLIKSSKGAGKAVKRKAEEIAGLTPYLFDVWDPRSGYAEFGPFGLQAYYREIHTTVGKLIDEFGDDARAVLKSSNRFDPVTFCRWWDTTRTTAWAADSLTPLIDEEIDQIPIVAQIAEGSNIFSKPEHQRQPFLYTAWRSGLWERQNLALTVLYTSLAQIGLTPTLILKTNDADRELDVDWSQMPAVIKLLGGESLEVLGSKGIIDPAFREALEISEQKISESTIYDQTLGEPLGKNAPFSMVALLHQAGRLPLVMPQRTAGWAIADAMRLAFNDMRENGLSGNYTGALADLDAKEIPENYELEAKLDIALPEDKLQQANIANMITEGEDPLVSKRYAREKVLNVGQSDDMTREIWTEQISNLKARKFILEQLMQIQQMEQAVLNPQPAAPQGMDGMMPGGPPMGMAPPGGVPPEMQGLPPEMAAGGMGGPAMPGQRMMPGGMPNEPGY
jgi:hypothetical protein